MRFVVADAALTGERGHHANMVRHIADAARARGFAPLIYGHVRLQPRIREALGAIPHFVAYTYTTDDSDPYCGWLMGFMTAKEMMRRDLHRLPPLMREDVLLVHSVTAAQMMAALEWAATLPEADCPLIVVEIVAGAGLEVRETGGIRVFIPPDPATNAQPALCRFASLFGPGVGRRPFHVITLDALVSEAYAQIMKRDIPTLPFATPAVTALRRRSASPLTIATLGHQSVAKGYHLMPDIIQNLLVTEKDVRFLVHSSDPDLGATPVRDPIEQARARLEQMAAGDPRIILEYRVVGMEEWPQLLDRCDLVLCPYDPEHYAVQHSGLASDAVANGIPLVVPAGTTLARWVDEFHTGAIFAPQNAAAISDTLREVIRNYDRYAAQAYAAAQMWAATRGPVGFLDALLKLRERLSSFAFADVTAATLVAEGLKAKGDAFLLEGDLDRARDDYRQALAEQPQLADAHGNLGMVLQQLGDLRGAEQALRRANALAPHNSLLRNNLALALAAMGRRAEAIAELEQAVAETPDQVALWVNLGNLYAAEDRGKAGAAYRKAEALNPDYPGLRERLGDG